MADEALTPKQEAFCLAYLETGNGAEAYRRAYDVKAAAQHQTIYSAASELLRNPKITHRLEELQSLAVQVSLYTINKAYDELEAARKLAMSEDVSNPSAAVSAITQKMKLFGMEKTGKMQVEHTGTNGGAIEIVSRIVAPD